VINHNSRRPDELQSLTARRCALSRRMRCEENHISHGDKTTGDVRRNTHVAEGDDARGSMASRRTIHSPVVNEFNNLRSL